MSRTALSMDGTAAGKAPSTLAGMAFLGMGAAAFDKARPSPTACKVRTLLARSSCMSMRARHLSQM